LLAVATGWKRQTAIYFRAKTRIANGLRLLPSTVAERLHTIEEDSMKAMAIAAAAAVASIPFLAQPADAAGCLKGAAVGGVAGHYLGHHGWLGAGVGCLVGRHRANARERQEMNNRNTTAGYGSSTYRTNYR
jgi:hypothetical protein